MLSPQPQNERQIGAADVYETYLGEVNAGIHQNSIKVHFLK